MFRISEDIRWEAQPLGYNSVDGIVQTVQDSRQLNSHRQTRRDAMQQFCRVGRCELGLTRPELN